MIAQLLQLLLLLLELVAPGRAVRVVLVVFVVAITVVSALSVRTLDVDATGMGSARSNNSVASHVTAAECVDAPRPQVLSVLRLFFCCVAIRSLTHSLSDSATLSLTDSL